MAVVLIAWWLWWLVAFVVSVPIAYNWAWDQWPLGSTPTGNGTFALIVGFFAFIWLPFVGLGKIVGKLLSNEDPLHR